jgi:hypothetical protein
MLFNFSHGKIAVATALLAAMASGCASFPQESLKNSKIPDVSTYKHRPSVYFDVKFFQGEPGDTKAAEMPALEARVKPIVEQVAKNSGLFSSYSFDAFQQGHVDQTIKLYFYNHGSTGAAAASGFISGFTFGLIPGEATDRYTLLTDAGTGVSGQLTSNDEIHTWIGIWFLPMAGNTPEKAVTTTFTQMLNDAFKQLVETRQLKLSIVYPYDVDNRG